MRSVCRAPFGVLALAVIVLTAAVTGGPAAGAQVVSLTVPGVRNVSQLTEPAPFGWAGEVATPYCAAAASLAVMASFGLQDPADPLRTAFAIGRRGNAFGPEPGLDPAGVSYLMKQFGGEGRVHAYEERSVALTELVGRLNAGVPVVIFAEAGFHAEVVYGYQADTATGQVTGIYGQDPYSGFRGLVPIGDFFGLYQWWGSRFNAAGSLWSGTYVFVSYRDFAGGPPPAVLQASPPQASPPQVTPPVTYRSGWVAQSAYPTMTLGGVGPVWIKVRNTGTATWTRGTPTEARIGVIGDDRTAADLGLAEGWPVPDRPAVQTEASVAPGQTATFAFSVRGARRGSYPLRLRPVIDGLAWMDDQGIYLQITVR